MEQVFASTQSRTCALPSIISAAFLATLTAHGVRQAVLFGSFAAGLAGEASDLDLLVAFDRPVILFEQLGLADRLAALCGRPVDLVVTLDPAFAPYIIPTLLPLPL